MSNRRPVPMEDHEMYEDLGYSPPDSTSSYTSKEPDKASRDKESDIHVLPDSPVSLASKDICDKLDQDLIAEDPHPPASAPEDFGKKTDREMPKESSKRCSKRLSKKRSFFDCSNSQDLPRSTRRNPRLLPDPESSSVGDAFVDSPSCSTSSASVCYSPDFQEYASPGFSTAFEERASPNYPSTSREHASMFSPTTFQEEPSLFDATDFQEPTSPSLLSVLQEPASPSSSTTFQRHSENVLLPFKLIPCYVNIYRCTFTPEEQAKLNDPSRNSGENSKSSGEQSNSSGDHSQASCDHSNAPNNHSESWGNHSKAPGKHQETFSEESSESGALAKKSREFSKKSREHSKDSGENSKDSGENSKESGENSKESGENSKESGENSKESGENSNNSSEITKNSVPNYPSTSREHAPLCSSTTVQEQPSPFCSTAFEHLKTSAELSNASHDQSKTSSELPRTSDELGKSSAPNYPSTSRENVPLCSSNTFLQEQSSPFCSTSLEHLKTSTEVSNTSHEQSETSNEQSRTSGELRKNSDDVPKNSTPNYPSTSRENVPLCSSNTFKEQSSSFCSTAFEHLKTLAELINTSHEQSKTSGELAKESVELTENSGEKSQTSAKRKLYEDRVQECRKRKCSVPLKPLPMLQEVFYKIHYGRKSLSHVIRIGYNQYRRKEKVNWKKVYDKHLKKPFVLLRYNEFVKIARRSVQDFLQSQELLDSKRRRAALIEQRENKIKQKRRVYYEKNSYVLFDRTDDNDELNEALKSMKWCRVICKPCDR